MWTEGAEILHRLGADPSVRVIIIESTGDRVFSGGADLSVLAEIDGNLERARQLVDRVEGLMASIEAASKPVIAAVSGAAIGAGAELAAACDIRLASATARFGVPAAALGVVITRTDIARLWRMAGGSAARDMLLTGRIFTADKALAAGMVRSVHPPRELPQAVDELADRLATLSPTALLGHEDPSQCDPTERPMGRRRPRALRHRPGVRRGRRAGSGRLGRPQTNPFLEGCCKTTIAVIRQDADQALCHRLTARWSVSLHPPRSPRCAPRLRHRRSSNPSVRSRSRGYEHRPEPDRAPARRRA